MKRCTKLNSEQKAELGVLIQKGRDIKEVRRAQAILMVNDALPYETIETLTKYKERAALIFRQRYLKIGLKGIEHKRKGRPKRLLSLEQRKEILGWLTVQSPKDFDYEEAHWSTSILAHLIQKKFRVVYKSKKPFYLLFEEAKYTFHKPGKVYEKRDETRVEVWKKERAPRLYEAFKDEGTIVLCEDEMILSSQTTFQKIWLKAGEYPKIEVSNTKNNQSIYGFLNIKTGLCHAFRRERQNMVITAEILKEIRKIYPDKKIVLLWDGAGWHRGSVVQEFLQEDGKIETIYFPPYSPEENPQEHVWKKGRSAVTHNTFIPDI